MSTEQSESNSLQRVAGSAAVKKKYEGLWPVAVEMPQSTVHSVHQFPDIDEHCWQVSPSP